MMDRVQKVTITLATALLMTTNHHHHSIVVQAQQESSIATAAAAKNVNYNPEQCTSWVSAAIASDTNQSASGGLSQSEFMTFLSNIPQLQGYFNANMTFGTLPFEVQLAYPTLACWCEELGQGKDCCKGPDPKIDVSALLLEDDPLGVAASYKQDFCALIGLVVMELSSPPPETTTTMMTTTVATTPASTVAATTITTTNPTAPTDPITFTITGSVIDYSTYPYTQIFDNTPPDKLPSYTTADDIKTNSESRQGVIGNLIQGFTALTLGMLEKCPVVTVEEDVEENKNNRTSEPVKTSVLPPGLLGSLDETLVNDIKCPEGLPYAPKDAFCVEFIITMKPSEGLAQYEGVRTCLVDNINTAIENGELYNIIQEISSNTQITGLGSPGEGVDYKNSTVGDAQESITTENNEGTTALSGGLIFLIILALFAVPLVTLTILRYRGKQAEELAKVREFAGEPAKDVDLENPPVVVPPATEEEGKQQEEEQKQGDHDDDDDDSSAPSVWSESRGSQPDVVYEDDNAANHPATAKLGSSLAAMGVASAVATNLYEKKNAGNNEEEDVEEAKRVEDIKVEVISLVEKTAPGKTAEELLSAYSGREEELVGHLRRLDRETNRL